jgi:hypothetical protein
LILEDRRKIKELVRLHLPLLPHLLLKLLRMMARPLRVQLNLQLERQPLQQLSLQLVQLNQLLANLPQLLLSQQVRPHPLHQLLERNLQLLQQARLLHLHQKEKSPQKLHQRNDTF